MLCSSFFWWPARVMPRPGRSLVRKGWIRLGVGPSPSISSFNIPCLVIRMSPFPPHQPHLLQAELSHITEGGEAKLGEVVLVALETNG